MLTVDPADPVPVMLMVVEEVISSVDEMPVSGSIPVMDGAEGTEGVPLVSTVMTTAVEALDETPAMLLDDQV